MSNKVLLMILDGYGYSASHEGNAVYSANTPNLDKLWENNPHLLLNCSGESVGLPDGQMGNSEVGHLNLGAGRIVYQELTRITKSIKDGDFFENEEFLKAVQNVKDNGSALHLMGLVSDGGVHSSNEHLYALLELAKRQGLEKVYVHCYMDGRDTPPKSGKGYIEELEEKIKEIGVGKIGVVSGRYYAMDRDKRWERTKKAYDALVYGIGEKADSAAEAMQHSYDNDVTDEFVLPTIVCEDAKISKNDSVIFFNFRPDRARQITRALVEDDFDGFDREEDLNLTFVTFTNYDASFKNVLIAFKPQVITNTLGEYLSNNGYTQLRIAETEKYAHVTYFFNGGVETEYKGEDRVLVASPKVATYDLKPEMSAYEVKDKLVDAINTKGYDFIAVNFANCDMVGHTGIFDAAVAAVEAVDKCVGEVTDAARNNDYSVIITADHGNAELMFEDGKPFTAHTTNKVKCIVESKLIKGVSEEAALCDVAPTILDLMDIKQPEEMTGKSFVEK